MCEVLIIDGEEHLAAQYREELNQNGYEASSVSSFKEGLRILEMSPGIKLVVLELVLNGKSMVEKLEILRKKFADLILVINTDYSLFKQDFRTWLADEFLVKSTDLAEFNQTINRLLSNAELKIDKKSMVRRIGTN